MTATRYAQEIQEQVTSPGGVCLSSAGAADQALQWRWWVRTEQREAMPDVPSVTLRHSPP